MTDLMQAVIPDMGYETPALDAYRKRFHAAVTYYTTRSSPARSPGRSARPPPPRSTLSRPPGWERQAELENTTKEFADIATALEEPLVASHDGGQ